MNSALPTQINVFLAVARRCLRKHRLPLIACLAAALGAGGYLLWPERMEAKVLRLLAEMRGTPSSRFGLALSPRLREAVVADLDRLGGEAVPELLAVVRRHPDSLMRYFAVMQLGRVRDRRAAPQLIRALKDPGPGVGAEAASALGDLGDQDAVVPLVACLASGNPSLRACAATALGKIGDRQAVQGLASLTGDPELTVRAFAVEALGRLGDPRALAPLIDALEQDESPWVRDLAIHALVRLGSGKCIPALERALHDDSPRVQEDAALALSLLAVPTTTDNATR